ncbi:UTP--GlnB (protein PII) uridylyltransferase GlnD [Varunaivibrio sulfuroxidans]|uniref:Bifunctional uridylyltransferase/uridylyl-removing enzyme n=2 Tax=Varunaivibrio sulfuroxidans TaxID=1773489 RepID=A0A4R3JGC3_9PROT|nr:UTP--GlnB (protein PII) uridylyltransferase GlnD [Varunaivibrio sulfuroxidans]WES32207.1 [protein-PII] uridylyltransferase [Varunaivibrio sulfuroxidans]
MLRIAHPRTVIHRKALAGELAALVAWSGYSAKTQSKVLAIFKDALAQGRAEVRRRFEEDGALGVDVLRANAYLIDQLVRAIHDFAATYVYPAANPTTGERMSIIATGGYGRAELAPHSDIDLMFLLPYKKTSHIEQVVEYILYMLWDLGLKVGHATRSVGDAVRLSKEDVTIQTSLLESRLLWGDEALYRKFQALFEKSIQSGGPAFVKAKLAERDARHDRMGDSRYVLEPNIKEGKGGLRDLQTLFWIAQFLYRVRDMRELVAKGVFTKGDARRFAKAQSFLWAVRCHLHYLADRPEEIISFTYQSTLAERMGYTDRAGSRGVERFMKHYFLVAKDVGDLTRVLCAVLEEGLKSQPGRFSLPSFSFRKRNVEGFRLDGNRLTIGDAADLQSHPIKLLSLFRAAQKFTHDIHPDAMRMVVQNLKRIDKVLRADAAANKVFLDILCDEKDPVTALKWLNEAGVLGRFIPDFGRVVAQMQYDMYHVYTVDEHTIRAIEILSKIERGLLGDDHPVSTNVIGHLQSRRVLYLAVFLHDIAKGRGGDHSILGAKVALKLCKRFALSDWESETVAWLVRHHLDMSRTAFKRDVEDPKTAIDFAKRVQSLERLRLLLILTVVDIRAVGPNVWNGWKATLLRDLFERTEEVLTGGMKGEHRAQRVMRVHERLRERLKEWPVADVEAHLERGYDSYWLGVETDLLVRHAFLLRRARQEGRAFMVEANVDDARAVSELMVYTPDHPGLFAHVAGALALSGASIVDAKVTTLTDGMALDTFWIQDSEGGAYDGEERLARLYERIEMALSGRLHPVRELAKARAQAMKSRTRVFKVAPRVLIDNTASNTFTVIEMNGRNRLGLLHDITAALTQLGLQIASAHIATYGERAVDVFYVKDVFGLKVDQQDKIKTVRQRLLKALAPPADAAPAKPAKKKRPLAKARAE